MTMGSESSVQLTDRRREPYAPRMLRSTVVMMWLCAACSSPAPQTIDASSDLASAAASDLATPGPGPGDLAMPSPPDQSIPDLDINDLAPLAMPDLNPRAMPDLQPPAMPDFNLPAMPDLSPLALPDLTTPAAPDLGPVAISDLSPACLSPLLLCLVNNAYQCLDPRVTLAHCGGCGQTCPARDHATVGCSAGDCQYVCETGSADVDGDLQAQPRTAVSNGCECQITNSLDVPDLDFTDTNCDGIDGDIGHAIFVSPRGSDQAAGTMTQPLLTLRAAIAAAKAASKDVYAAKGMYYESVTLVDGVNLFGGYDDATPSRWKRSLTSVTSIRGGSTAVIATNLSTNVEIQLCDIQAVSGTGPGTSSYGVRILNSSANATVTLRADTISAADGVAGKTSGPDGSNGANGANGVSGNGAPNGGAGGASACGSAGGAGAAAVTGLKTGQRGGDGKGPGGGSGGSGTSDNPQCGGPSQSAPDDAVAGAAGTPGVNGSVAQSIGKLDGSGFYVPPISASGSSGANGGGGGGGGAGSGTCLSGGSPCYCSCCNPDAGGSGGGGGAGGCGATAGPGATGGGASFAVVAIQSHVVITGSLLTVGNGGSGGAGGNGGVGGSAGMGATGAPGGNAGAGAPGKNGGSGGAGGGAAGAPGGPAACVVYGNGSVSPTLDQSTCNRGGGGAGGRGGSNATLGPAAPGATGASADVLAI